jgi:hypothetical protein
MRFLRLSCGVVFSKNIALLFAGPHVIGDVPLVVFDRLSRLGQAFASRKNHAPSRAHIHVTISMALTVFVGLV